MIRELTADCVHCGFCLPTCPTYVLWREEMDSPRGRIHLMDARLDGTVTLNATVTEHFDRCLGCMACVSSCPSGVRYDRLIETTRAAVEREHDRPFGERLLRGLLFRVLPYPGRMRAALRLAPLGRACRCRAGSVRSSSSRRPGAAAGRSATITPAEGVQRGRVGLLTGCVQSAVFPDVNAATARVLAADGFQVVAPPQGCCGALSVHAGRLEEGKAFARKLIGASTASTLVVVNASGCGSHLKELGWLLERRARSGVRGQGARRRRAARRGSAARAAPSALARVALQDSCHLRHAQGLPLASLPALSRIPALEVVEPAEQDLCCGSAGIYNLVQPEAARELGDRKAANVLATGAQAYASANPGCLVQVSPALRRARRPLPAFHPIELVDASIRNVGAARLAAAARRSGGSSATGPQLVQPVDARKRREQPPPEHRDPDRRDAADHDSGYGADERRRDPGLERAELVRRADEDHLDRVHAPAELVRRDERQDRRAEDHAHEVERRRRARARASTATSAARARTRPSRRRTRRRR